MAQSKAKGLTYWCEHLSNTQLPVLTSSVRSLNQTPRVDSTAYSRLVTLTEHDPVLCWHLLYSANLLNNNPNTDIESLQLAISMIGQDKFWEIVDKAPKLKPNPASRFQQSYLRELSLSLFAGFLARDWSKMGGIGQPEALYWDTLIARSPMWALWYIAYPEMQEWQHATQVEHKSAHETELRIFGGTIQEICHTVTRGWQMPKSSHESWNTLHLPTPKDLVQLSHDDFFYVLDNKVSLRLITQQPHYFSYLAHWAAYESRWNWNNTHLTRCLKVIAHCLKKSFDEVQSHLHQQAAAASRFFTAPGLATPAVNLIWTEPASWPIPPLFKPIYEFAKDEPVTAGVKQSKAKAAEKGSLPETHTATRSVKLNGNEPVHQVNYAALHRIMDNLTLNNEGLGDIHHVFSLCMQGVCKGIGLQRAFACLLNPHHKTIKVCYSEGFASTDPIRKLSLPLNQAPLFTHLLRHPSSLHIDARSIDKIKDKMPKDLITRIETNDFVLMSVFAGARPIGVVYADAYHPTFTDRVIQADEYEAFKKLCHAICVGLDYVAKQQRKRKKKA